MAGGGPGSHGSTKQNYDLDQIWGDLREGIEHVSIMIFIPTKMDINSIIWGNKTYILV